MSSRVRCLRRELFGLPIRLNPEKNEFYGIVDQTRGVNTAKHPCYFSSLPQGRL